MQPELDHYIEYLEKFSYNPYWAENGELGKRIFKKKK